MLYFNEDYHNYSLPCLHEVDDIFKVMGSKVKERQHLPKVHSSGRDITDRRSAVEGCRVIINDSVKVHKKLGLIQMKSLNVCRTEAAMLHTFNKLQCII